VTQSRLILRNLTHFRAANLAVALGMAVATAVLTGALMVGDSVRGSLRALAVQRLGSVDHAMVATRFFDESLAQRIRRTTFGNASELVPAILVRGGAKSADGAARTSGVQIAAVDASWLKVAQGEAIANGEVADALGVSKPGEPIVYTVATALDAPRDATLARRGSSEVTSGDRVQVARVERQPGFVSLFNLEGSQRVPRNLWLNLPDLQRSVDQPGRVNAIFASGAGGTDVAVLNRALREAVTLSDYGLTIDRDAKRADAVLNSRATFIDSPVIEAAHAVAREMKASVNEVSVYLINDVTVQGANGKAIHYAVAAGLSDVNGIKLADNQIVLNQWTAEQLEAKQGGVLELAYYRRDSAGELRVVRSPPMSLAEIIPMSGVGADPALRPGYKGLTDAASVADWNPPQGVEIDKSKVSKADEAYWTQYRAAPKLFVGLATARRLWGSAFGDVTSLRLPAGRADEFATKLRDKIDPAAMGLALQPVRARQLAAASGGTDFAMLFVAFSFFLIVAAVLLVAMLFRLNIEQRARQVGLLAAVGFSPRRLRLIALAEGMTLAMLGGLVGLTGAIGYTWLMVAGLRTWWKGAVGTTAMRLYVVPSTLAIGLAASLVAAFFAVLWGVWRVGRTPEARLLAGGWNDPNAAKVRSGHWATRAGVVGIVLGVMVILSSFAKPAMAQAAFLGGGSMLLTACLLLMSGRLKPKSHGGVTPATTLPRLGLRNASRHTARSVLSAGLIAFAAFTLVTVASLKQGEPGNTDEKRSGAGGYRLILQSAIPLTGDLSTPRGRELLGMSDANAALWNRVKFTSMRTWAGQDVSCLNLTRPDSPTIVAVPSADAWKGRFEFARTIRRAGSGWDLLNEKSGDANVVPVVADDETAQYILHLGLGDTLRITDQRGVPRQLKLVGTIKHSIFQSELLMSEREFVKLFPAQGGFGTVLVEAGEADARDVQKQLNTDLESYAVTVDTTAARLAAYAEVANTYLSTFQTLGSLGLMLGAIGLAVVLLRGLVERRAELALLSAIGFAPASRVKLVLAENAFLLVAGLAIGAGCAIVGILPTLKTGARTMNIPALAATLAAVLVIGLAGLAVAVWLGQRRITPADLRAE
jgi:ABC-type antimicrobial peptide transport system permease subunit